MKDLRDWLAVVEEAGQLHRVTEEVDWDEDLSAITYMVAQQEDSPVLMFENVKDARPGFSAVANLLGSNYERVALALRLSGFTSVQAAISEARGKLNVRIPPKEIDAAQAPVNEIVLRGSDVDLSIFPAPKMWPRDGGRYLGTGNITITRDPESGYVNLGVYRQMIQSRNELGLYMSPGKDALLHLDRAWASGKPLPVAVAYGIDPLLFIIGALGYPKNVPEYEYVGGVLGEGIEVFEGDVTGLPIPAHAEIVLEGFLHPNELKPEGPFGEFQGYYGRPGGPTPCIDVQCVRYRANPILTCSLMSDYPACDQNGFYSIARTARLLDDLETLGIPGVQGAYFFPSAAGNHGMLAVSIEQRYAGHAAQVAALAAQCPSSAYMTKWIVVVDHDIDPTNWHQVIWAMSTRCHPPDDIDILRQTWSTYLDPTRNPPEHRPYGAKVLINACMEHRYLKQFARRTALRRATYDRVVENWYKLGLPGNPPEIRHFDNMDEAGGA